MKSHRDEQDHSKSSECGGLGGLGAWDRQEGFIQLLCQLCLVTVIPKKPVAVNCLQAHKAENQPSSQPQFRVPPSQFWPGVTAMQWWFLDMSLGLYHDWHPPERLSPLPTPHQHNFNLSQVHNDSWLLRGVLWQGGLPQHVEDVRKSWNCLFWVMPSRCSYTGSTTRSLGSYQKERDWADQDSLLCCPQSLEHMGDGIWQSASGTYLLHCYIIHLPSYFLKGPSD